MIELSSFVRMHHPSSALKFWDFLLQGRIQDLVLGGGDEIRQGYLTVLFIIVSGVYGTYDSGKLK